jgi:hypothetical protein
VQPTTLPFGQKNSGTEVQGPYRAAAGEMQRERYGNYVDDWIGYSNDIDQFVEDFARFLEVCNKYSITLGISKTKLGRFGYPEAQIFGFRVNKQGSHLALKHLDPIRNIVPFTDVHELGRVLGLFVVSRNYLQDYALISRPMTEILQGKPPTFRWGPEQQQSFDDIRDRLLVKKILHAGPVERWDIDQRILNAKLNQELFTKVRQNELDTAQAPRKITANRKQRSQLANSIKILGSASLGLSASLSMIKTTDLILRA